MTKKTKIDAWEQYDNLVRSFTTEVKPRPNLEVRAIAHHRNVQLSLGTPRDDYKGKWDIRGKYKWTTTTRNVNTMRELAEAILAACDFVDEMNPEWASRRSPDGKINIIS